MQNFMSKYLEKMVVERMSMIPLDHFYLTNRIKHLNIYRKSSRLARKTSREEVTEKDLSPRGPMEIQEDDIERDLKETGKFMSKFPFFKVFMNYTHDNSGIMNIPASFFKHYMENNRRIVTLVVSDKLWPVKLVLCGGRNVCRFSGAWLVFCEENTIK
ncbi:hypothetical protein ACSBR2_024908 [Camellia fascicularis]